MKIRSLAVAALCTLAVPVAVLAGPAKAGKWETTVETTLGDRTMPARTTTHCVTKEEADHAENIVPKPQRGDCAVKDVKVDGSTVSWKMTCEKSGTEGEGTMTYSGDSYTGHMTMKTPQFEVKVKYNGKYLGACDGQ